MDMVNPQGTLGRSFRKGYIDVSEGATTLIVKRPSADDLSYVPMVITNWNTALAISSFSLGEFTVTFQTPAPSGARVRWIFFT